MRSKIIHKKFRLSYYNIPNTVFGQLSSLDAQGFPKKKTDLIHLSYMSLYV